MSGKLFREHSSLRRRRGRAYVFGVSYTVFARKYRPQTFDDVVGQDHITQTLKNAIVQNRLAHAYIFVGPRGTGKTSTARILAKALNCKTGPTVSPCGVCSSCVEITAGNSMDVLEFDAASNTQVDKIREIIIDNVKYAPTNGKFKMYIVDEVHMLSTSSFNALLKTLEEPPEHVKFVFATTDVQKVPTTILSRCQRFDLKRIPTALIASHLQMIAGKEGVDLAPAAAETIARGAEGGMRDAESMLDQLVAFCGNTIAEEDVLNIFGFTAHHTVSTLSDHLLAGDASATLAVVHEQAEGGKDLSRLLSDLIAHFRNLLIAKADPAGLADELSEEQVAGLAEQASRVAMDRLLELIEQFAAAEGRMKWAPNKKMHIEIAVIRAIQTLHQATLTEVLDTLTAMRGGTPPPVLQKPALPVAPVAAKPVAKPAPAAPKAVEEKSVTLAARRQDAPAAAVKETPPAPTAPAAPAPATAPAAPAALGPVDPSAIWPALIQEVRANRPKLRMWVETGALTAIEGDIAHITFPDDQTLSLQHCEERENRAYLETLLSTLAGRSLKAKFEMRSDFTVTPVPVAKAIETKAEAARDPMEEFKNDALILKALEIFKAEIATS